MLYFDFEKRDLETGKTWAEFTTERGITGANMALGEAWERRKAEARLTVDHEPVSPPDRRSTTAGQRTLAR